MVGEVMRDSTNIPGSGQHLGRIKCVVDVGQSSIEIDPYVADFFFEPVFLSRSYPDLTCTAQVLGKEGEKHPSLLEVKIISKKKGIRNFALSVISEDLFSEPKTFSVVFSFDSERLHAPMLLEVEVKVIHAGTPIIARIRSGLPSSFIGSVSSDLSGITPRLRIERAMTFWDWPLENARLEVKADESWLENFGSIEVLYDNGGPGNSTKLTDEFQEVDFDAVIPLMLPREGFPHAPYHTCAGMLLRIGDDASQFPIVSHLVDTRPSKRGAFGKIGKLDDPDAWPYFLWKNPHFKMQPPGEKFLIRKGRLWEGFRRLEPGKPGTIKRVQHERYTSAVPTRAKFEYKGEEFNVNWFQLDESGWKVHFSDS
jgi:hypothetical protein